MYLARLLAQDDFAAWRDAARALLAANVPPDAMMWQVGEAADPPLFATRPLPPPCPLGAAPRLSRALLSQMQTALLHRDAARFDLAYRIAWRARAAPALHLNPADPDIIALTRLTKAVRRDMHKMHAFVRFRKVGEAAGRERFAAWFEPDHHITRAVAGFFRDRFAGMDWLIVTPDASIGWDGESLHTGPGGTRGDVPADDAIEDEWRTYYASIFNPARVKVAAMKKEMPVRYWRNLPETMLIRPLIAAAGVRVDRMVQVQPSATPAPAPARADRPAAGFATLDALYAALAAQDVPPSPGFSDRVVFGEGPVGARLMLVGEQPGEKEDEVGRPFVGPAGQLLDRCLGEAGIDRSRLYLANAVKRFKSVPRGKRRLHQSPSAGDVAHYRWWLGEEIRLVDPAVVVALGATAVHALTGRRQALSPLRGPPLPLDGRALVVTIHPSFLLRLLDAQGQAIERARFVRELAAADRLAGDGATARRDSRAAPG